DVSTLPFDTLRAAINVTAQDPFLLPATIHFNINPRGDRSDEKLLEALEEVGLKERVVELGGLDKELGISKWSTGQKQLLSLARPSLRGESIWCLMKL
ncbi:hypothetical protein CC80DRAFT_423445, partial [Byssothecium circinans]